MKKTVIIVIPTFNYELIVDDSVTGYHWALHFTYSYGNKKPAIICDKHQKVDTPS